VRDWLRRTVEAKNAVRSAVEAGALGGAAREAVCCAWLGCRVAERREAELFNPSCRYFAEHWIALPAFALATGTTGSAPAGELVTGVVKIAILAVTRLA
jgi:hypothetical protein